MGRFKKQFYNEDLENYSEEIVFEQLYHIVEAGSEDFCQCEICIQDIAAIVLNRVPTLYCCSLLEKITPNDDFMGKIEEVRAMAKKELSNAIEMVRRKNNH